MRYSLPVILVLVFVSCSGPQSANDGDTPEGAVPYPNPNFETRVLLYSRPHEKLQTYFKNNVDSLNVEFALCFYGQMRNDTLVVKEIEFPPQHQKHTVVYARYDLCSSNNMVAIAHAHPNATFNNKYSQRDYESLRWWGKSLGIRCGVLMYRSHGSGPVHLKIYTPRKSAKNGSLTISQPITAI